MRIILLLLFLFSGIVCLAQTTVIAGLQPQLGLSKALSQKWKGTAKVEMQHILLRTEGGDLGFHSEFNRVDIAALISRKTGTGNSLTGGYQIRFHNSSPEYRLIQQYAFSSGRSAVRMGHRIAADQTFSARSAPEFRFRYRISFEFPLSGQTSDPGEYYLKLNQESLPSFQSNDFLLEFRALAAIGYVFSDSRKVEAGIDYRLDRILESALRHRIWLTFGSYLSF